MICKTKVAPAPGKGRGVFATRDLWGWEVITSNPANLYTEEEAKVLLASPAFPYVFQDPADASQHFLTWGEIALLNHSPDPNAVVTFRLNTRGGWECFLLANRPISEGEEITMQYANAGDYDGLF